MMNIMWLIVSIALTIIALVGLAIAIKNGIAKSADQAEYDEFVAEYGEDTDDQALHRSEQSRLNGGLIAALVVLVLFGVGAGFSWANPGFYNQFAPGSASASTIRPASSGSSGSASATASAEKQAKKELGYYLVETVNSVQVKQVIGEGDVTTNREVHQDYVTEVTGYEDGYAAPYSSKSLNEAAARAETQGAIFDKSTRKGNVHAAYGYVSVTLYLVGDDILADMPELQRLMNAYQAQGAEAFYETENNQFKVAKADDAFFYNEDGKLLLAIAYTLFSDGHLKFYGTEHHATRVNWHSNAALVDSDRRIELNPKQYEGDFYVWGYEWKGYEFEHFGTNCGAANGLGCGDKRPALFASPAPEVTTPGGSNPGTGGGDQPSPGPNPKPDNPDQPGVEPVKDPNEDPVKKGNAPIGGGKDDDPGPGAFEKKDHPAESSGASPDAGDDDGSSKSSNQVQDPSATQDGSTPPAVEEIPVTRDTTVTDNETGQTTDTSKETVESGQKVDPD